MLFVVTMLLFSSRFLPEFEKNNEKHSGQRDRTQVSTVERQTESGSLCQPRVARMWRNPG